MERLQEWVGRSQTLHDVASPGPISGLAALLDHEAPPWPTGEVPLLGHWLYFLRHGRQSTLDRDGHPRRGDFLPPVALPRRMWAGSTVNFLHPIPIGSEIVRHSTISAVTAKQGRSGSMVFVTVRHELQVGSRVALTEDQDIVYRSPPSTGAAPAPPIALPISGDIRQAVTATTVSLFRFSALTSNAHRIHYDRNYAQDVEGYPGLVVHGPYLATLLMDQFLRHSSTRKVSVFTFRAERPVFDISPFELSCTMTPAGADLRVIDHDGASSLSASVKTPTGRGLERVSTG